MNTFVSGIEIRPFDEAAAIEFGKIATVLKKQGTPIGQYHMLIAAHALSLQCAVVTSNLEYFSQVPGLESKSWE